jgi:DNA-binding transcriptional LysR family regulator
MNLNQVNAFLVLSEELHFGRTAERLYVSQPHVSRIISSLESEIGGALFERTSRKVNLTPLGARFLTAIQPCFGQLQQALNDACDAARGVTGRLRLGCLVTVGGLALTRLVTEFCERYPDCELTVDTVPTRDPYLPLRQGEIEVLVSLLVGGETHEADQTDLSFGPVIECRDRMLAVGRGHRLATEESVSIEDVAEEEVHENAPTFPSAVYDALAPPVTPTGRPIRRTYPWISDDDVLTAVARGRIVHPTMAGTAVFTRPDIVLIPFRDVAPTKIGLVWSKAHVNARIRALADLAQSLSPIRVAAGA